MKKLIICMLLGFSLNSAFAQIPVTDAALAGYLQTSDQIKSATDKSRFAQTMAEIKTQIQFMEKEADRFRKINSAINSGFQVARIAKRQAELSQEIIDGIHNSAGSRFSITTKDKIINNLMQQQHITRQLFSEVKKVISSNVFKMNDAERISYLNRLESDINKNLSSIKRYNYSINRMNSVYKQYERF